MNRSEWFSALRDLHAKSQRDPLSDDESAFYEAGRDQIAWAILSAKGVSIPQGASPRDFLWVRHAAQVDLHLPTGRLRTLTVEIGARGIVVRLPSTGVPQDAIRASLRLPGGGGVEAVVRVDSAQRSGSLAEVTFLFESLPPRDHASVSRTVFGLVLTSFLESAPAAARA